MYPMIITKFLKHRKFYFQLMKYIEEKNYTFTTSQEPKKKKLISYAK